MLQIDEQRACEREVELGKKHKVNTVCYSKDYYTSAQMHCARIALEAGLNPKRILDNDSLEDRAEEDLKHIFKKAGRSADLQLYKECPEIITELLEDDFNTILNFMKGRL